MPSSDLIEQQSSQQAMTQQVSAAVHLNREEIKDGRDSLLRDSSIKSSIQYDEQQIQSQNQAAPQSETIQRRTDVRGGMEASTANQMLMTNGNPSVDGEPKAVYIDPQNYEEKDVDESQDSQDSSNLIRKQRKNQSVLNRREESVQRSWMFRRDAEEHYFGSIVLTGSNVRGSALGSIIAKSKKEFATFVQSQD